MKPLVIIRPRPGSDASVAAAQAMGLDARAVPLFEVRPLPWDVVERDTFDALLIGSANALRHGGAALRNYAGMPAYAVGASTAQACREAGLDVIATGEGGLQDLLDQIDPTHTRLLRLAGARRVALYPPPNLTIVEREVYSSDPLAMPQPLADLLGQQECVVALHSAEAARHLRGECERLAIDKSRISLAVIGPRVAQAAEGGWQAVQSAEKPREEALLALASAMCKGDRRPQPTDDTARRGPMQDQTATGAPPLAVTSQRRSARGQITVALLAFLLGAALVAWSVWRGYFDAWIPANRTPTQAASGEPAANNEDAGGPALAALGERNPLETISSVEARLAMLEDRLSRLDLQANAASGNAARAESLLIAFAARRMVDRGEPLRYLADQLELRFGNAQPRAVKTILEFSMSPVTVDGLSARLEALAPQLTGNSSDESFWASAWRDLSDLFTIRREASPVMNSQARIDRARVMLRAGRISEAIEEVKRLPGADAASNWLADAQRYADAQHALDLIETAAMLEPTRLKDSEGNQVKQPSPLATPTATPDAESAQPLE